MSENTTPTQNGTDATLADYDETETETCPNGSEFCATTGDDEIGCFDCFCDEERPDDDDDDGREIVTDGGVNVADAAAETDAVDDLTDREIRGLTEYLVVCPTDADGLYTVYSEDGTPRTVDVRDGACDCPDAAYNDFAGPCKHEAAAAFLLGEREIPAWVDADSIHAQLAAELQEEDDGEGDVDRGDGVVTDGGDGFAYFDPKGNGSLECSDRPVAVADDCPECGSEETFTSEFAAEVAEELDHLSAWCEACGHGFGADALADDVDRGRGVATDGGRPLAREERAREPAASGAGAYAYAVEDPQCDSCDDRADDLAVTPAGLLCRTCAADVAEEVRR